MTAMISSRLRILFASITTCSGLPPPLADLSATHLTLPPPRSPRARSQGHRGHHSRDSSLTEDSYVPMFPQSTDNNYMPMRLGESAPYRLSDSTHHVDGTYVFCRSCRTDGAETEIGLRNRLVNLKGRVHAVQCHGCTAVRC